MKIIRKILSVVLVGVLSIGVSISVYAAESDVDSCDYVPNEGVISDISDVFEMEMQDGEVTIIGNYVVEYQEETICLNPYSRATTRDYVSTSHYKITNNGNEQEWYKVVQTTNYTYDGVTARINSSNCNLNVTTYYSDCQYTVNINTVDNSSSTDPTYTIGLTMRLPSQYITIRDVVTVHANGTHNKAHYE